MTPSIRRLTRKAFRRRSRSSSKGTDASSSSSQALESVTAVSTPPSSGPSSKRNTADIPTSERDYTGNQVDQTVSSAVEVSKSLPSTARKSTSAGTKLDETGSIIIGLGKTAPPTPGTDDPNYGETPIGIGSLPAVPARGGSSQATPAIEKPIPAAPTTEEKDDTLATTPTTADGIPGPGENPVGIDEKGNRLSGTPIIADDDSRFEDNPLGIGSSKSFENIYADRPKLVRTIDLIRNDALINSPCVEVIQNMSKAVCRSLDTPGIEAIRSGCLAIKVILKKIDWRNGPKEDIKGKKPDRALQTDSDASVLTSFPLLVVDRESAIEPERFRT